MKKKHIVALLLMMALSLCGCAPQVDTPTVPTLRHPVSQRPALEQAYIDDIFILDLYELTVVPYVQPVASLLGGKAAEVYVYPGKTVEKGEVLLVLDQTSTRNAAARLEQQLADRLATQEYTEATGKLDLQILEVELEQLKAREAAPVQIALKENEIRQLLLEQESQRTLWEMDQKELEDELAALKETLEQGTIRAPISGRVAYCQGLTGGTQIQSSRPFCYIADDSVLTLEGPELPQYFFDNADEVYVLMGAERYSSQLLSSEESANLTPDAEGKGYYRLLDAEGQPVTLTLGQKAQMCIIRSRAEDALLIPTAAIQEDGSQRYVYVYENGGRHRRDITTGLWQNGLAQVTSGLEEGEYVYVS